jgi:hypothetical protein
VDVALLVFMLCSFAVRATPDGAALTGRSRHRPRV